MTKASKKSSSSKNTNTIKPLYKAEKLTKNSSKDLWVAFRAGSTPKTGLVYSSTLTRDAIRYNASKLLSVDMNDVRSRRVRNMENRALTNRW